MVKRDYKKMAFIGGQLITGTGEDAIQDSVVLVDNGKIVYAGSRAGAPDTQWYEERDITGKTIMPGLCDAHLHFSGNLTDNSSDWVNEPNEQKTVIAVQQARECIEHGLTLVGEISRQGIFIRDMITDGHMRGPRMVCTGRGFCATASHGDSRHCSQEANWASHPWAETVDGPWDLRKAVRRKLRESPDAIKIWATGGDINRWDTARHQHYTLEEIQAVVDEAAMRGIPVWSHCYGPATDSIKAGVDLIIHGFVLEDEDIDVMVEKGIPLCTTINFLPAWLATYPPKYHPMVHDKYEGDTVVEKELNKIYSAMKRAHENGVMLVTGSDSFNSDSTPFGVTLIGEIHALVDHCGLTEMEAIMAGTSNGAKALESYFLTGSVTRGKCADLLVIDGDPLKDIHDICVENMDVIMKDGEMFRDRLC